MPGLDPVVSFQIADSEADTGNRGEYPDDICIRIEVKRAFPPIAELSLPGKEPAGYGETEESLFFEKSHAVPHAGFGIGDIIHEAHQDEIIIAAARDAEKVPDLKLANFLQMLFRRFARASSTIPGAKSIPVTSFAPSIARPTE